jgi:hypothetical protein
MVNSLLRTRSPDAKASTASSVIFVRGLQGEGAQQWCGTVAAADLDRPGPEQTACLGSEAEPPGESDGRDRARTAI